MNYCSNCGALLPAGARFCAECRSPVPVVLAQQIQTLDQRPARSKKQVILIVFAVFIGVGIFGPVLNKASGTSSDPSSDGAAGSLTATPLRTPSETLEAMIVQSLGPRNMGAPIVNISKDPVPHIIVSWMLNDNVTQGLIKAGAQLDMVHMLQACSRSAVPFSTVTTMGLFPKTDTFGKSRNQVVIHATYSAATLAKVNWDGFSMSNVYKIADDATVDPSLLP